MNILLGYKKCTTCKNVEKLLRDAGIEYTYRELDKDTPTINELKDLHIKSGVDIGKLFNTSGIKYRELGLAAKRESMTDEECYELLSSDGMLIKRPILVLEDGNIYIGNKVKAYLNERLGK